MIEWFTWLQVAVAVGAGVLCIGLGLAKQLPNDYSLGAVLLVEALLLVQLVMAIVAPGLGNTPSGSTLEFYTYLISAIVLLPVAGIWGLTERTRWSTIILGVAALSAAVMIYRMYFIWALQVG